MIMRGLPSVYLHYNETARVHAIWYLVVSAVGLVLGVLSRAFWGVVQRQQKIG